jgi:hypothetical protein
MRPAPIAGASLADVARFEAAPPMPADHAHKALSHRRLLIGPYSRRPKPSRRKLRVPMRAITTLEPDRVTRCARRRDCRTSSDAVKSIPLTRGTPRRVAPGSPGHHPSGLGVSSRLRKESGTGIDGLDVDAGAGVDDTEAAADSAQDGRKTPWAISRGSPTIFRARSSASPSAPQGRLDFVLAPTKAKVVAKAGRTR